MADTLLQPGETLGPAVTQAQTPQPAQDQNAGLLRAGESLGAPVADTTPPPTPSKSFGTQATDAIQTMAGDFGLPSNMQQIREANKMLPDQLSHPIDNLKKLAHQTAASVLQPNSTEALDRSREEWQKGNYGEAARHFVNYLIPFVGGSMDRAGDDMQHGDYGKALGHVTAAVLPILFGPKPGEAPITSVEEGVKAANARGEYVPPSQSMVSAASEKLGNVGTKVGVAAGAATAKVATKAGAGAMRYVIVPAAKGAANAAVEMTGEALTDLGNKITESIANNAGDVKGAVTDALTSAGDAGKALLDKAGDIASSIKQGAGPIKDQVLGALQDHIQPIAGMASDAAKEAWGVGSVVLDNVSSSITDLLNKAIKESKDAGTPAQAAGSLRNLRLSVQAELDKAGVPREFHSDIMDKVEESYVNSHSVSGGMTIDGEGTTGAPESLPFGAQTLDDAKVLASKIWNETDGKSMLQKTIGGTMAGRIVGKLTGNPLGGAAIGAGLGASSELLRATAKVLSRDYGMTTEAAAAKVSALYNETLKQGVTDTINTVAEKAKAAGKYVADVADKATKPAPTDVAAAMKTTPGIADIATAGEQLGGGAKDIEGVIRRNPSAAKYLAAQDDVAASKVPQILQGVIDDVTGQHLSSNGTMRAIGMAPMDTDVPASAGGVPMMSYGQFFDNLIRTNSNEFRQMFEGVTKDLAPEIRTRALGHLEQGIAQRIFENSFDTEGGFDLTGFRKLLDANKQKLGSTYDRMEVVNRGLKQLNDSWEASRKSAGAYKGIGDITLGNVSSKIVKGVVTGGLVGAVVGGPVGFILGAAAEIVGEHLVTNVAPEVVARVLMQPGAVENMNRLMQWYTKSASRVPTPVIKAIARSINAEVNKQKNVVLKGVKNLASTPKVATAK